MSTLAAATSSPDAPSRVVRGDGVVVSRVSFDGRELALVDTTKRVIRVVRAVVDAVHDLALTSQAAFDRRHAVSIRHSKRECRTTPLEMTVSFLIVMNRKSAAPPASAALA